MGRDACVLVTDPELIKQVTVKDFNSFMDHAVSDWAARIHVLIIKIIKIINVTLYYRQWRYFLNRMVVKDCSLRLEKCGESRDTF